MIQWVWEAAANAGCFSRILVAVEDQELFDVVRGFGGEPVLTGECASGTDRVAAAAKGIAADIVVNVQGDEPLLEPRVLSQLVDTLRFASWASIGTLVSAAQSDELTDRNAVKAVLGRGGKVLFFSREPIGADEAGRFWKHIGVYAYRREALERFVAAAPVPLEKTERLEQLRALWYGETFCAVTSPPTVSVDVPSDVLRAELALRARAESVAGTFREDTIRR